MQIENLDVGRLMKVPSLDGDEPDKRLVRVDEVQRLESVGNDYPASVMVYGFFEGTETRTGFRRPVGTEVQVML